MAGQVKVDVVLQQIIDHHRETMADDELDVVRVVVMHRDLFKIVTGPNDVYETGEKKISVDLKGYGQVEFWYASPLMDGAWFDAKMDYKIDEKVLDLKTNYRQFLEKAVFHCQVSSATPPFPVWSVKKTEAFFSEGNVPTDEEEIKALLIALKPLTRISLAAAIQGLIGAYLLAIWDGSDKELKKELDIFCVPFFVDFLLNTSNGAGEDAGDDVKVVTLLNSLPFAPSEIKSILDGLVDLLEVSLSEPPRKMMKFTKVQKRDPDPGRIRDTYNNTKKKVVITKDLHPIFDVHVPKGGTVKITRTMANGGSREFAIKVSGVGWASKKSKITTLAQTFEEMHDCHRLSCYFDIHRYQGKVVLVNPTNCLKLEKVCFGGACTSFSGDSGTLRKSCAMSREYKEALKKGEKGCGSIETFEQANDFSRELSLNPSGDIKGIVTFEAGFKMGWSKNEGLSVEYYFPPGVDNYGISMPDSPDCLFKWQWT